MGLILPMTAFFEWRRMLIRHHSNALSLKKSAPIAHQINLSTRPSIASGVS